ncbi:unnamed protein product [Mytilus coruscus]|uniref:Uncharacterized protein n=1 Tax=Mytilus coruscus TaxID=42192 RepID=A0A6J8EK09_MYTCO|nr:unnamed protein product [Mytilus coruscus]
MVTAYFNQPLWQDIQHVSNQLIYGDDTSEEELEEVESVLPEQGEDKSLEFNTALVLTFFGTLVNYYHQFLGIVNRIAPRQGIQPPQNVPMQQDPQPRAQPPQNIPMQQDPQPRAQPPQNIPMQQDPQPRVQRTQLIPMQQDPQPRVQQPLLQPQDPPRIKRSQRGRHPVVKLYL